MKKSKVILVVSVVVVALVVGAIAFFSVNALQASDDSALPSYTKKDMTKLLGSPENPYTILEIVPDEESAALGYLISGQEPQNLKAIGSTDLNNPASAAAIYKEAFASKTSPSAYVGDRANAYIFDADKTSIGTTPVSGFAEKEDKYESEASPGTDMAYSEFGYFTKVSGGKGAYNYDYTHKCFIPAAEGNYTWTSVGEFQHVGTGQVPQGSVPCARMLDNSLGEDRGYTYDSDKNTGAVGESAFKYYYSPMGDFVWVPNNYFSNEDIFRENATDDDIKAAKDGDKLYMTRTEKKYYVYESSVIICNDIPIKYLVGPDATAMTFKTQIVSVTPKQLKVDDLNTSEADKAKDLIDTCDAIYVHNSAIGYRIADALKSEPASGEEEGFVPPRDFDKSSTSGDLSLKTAERIIERGAEGVSKDAFGQVTKGPAAIIFDEEAIESANSYKLQNGNPDNTKNCPNLKLIYDVYNNLGAKLAYNWLQSKSYSQKLDEASKQQGYRNFSYNETDALGKSQFVFNYTGEDDSWLTTDFGNESKVAKTALNAPAFTDVNTFINADCGNSMSVAKMFMAINLEADAYNQPDHLRILEIEPNEQYMYNANDKDSWVKYYLDLMPWYVGTSADIGKDVTITAMPTYEFIGKNEDVNENYDMIIIGNHQQDETNGAQGYNDVGDLTWEDIYNPKVGVYGLWSYDGTGWNTLSYTAVGDYITTYGGKTDDELRTNTDSDDYKWNYGMYRDNLWSNNSRGYTRNQNKWRDNWEGVFTSDMVKGVLGVLTIGLKDYYSIKNDHSVYATRHGSDANMVGLRYSGNDITKKKYDQLVDFSTQGPVVVDNKLYWDESSDRKNEANELSVDQSSFVYKLANMNKDENTTVYKYARGVEATSKSNDIKSHLTSYSCSVDFTNTINGKEGYPKEYNQNSGNNYNEQTNSSGNNVLEYHFVLNGDKNTLYGVNLYTDSNGNGIFEGCINHLKERAANGDTSSFDNELASNLIIFDETEKQNVYNGVLKPGNTYLVTKVLPDSELGMVPWKLEIYNQAKDSVRFSEIGYTRIKAQGASEPKTIKVLQMNLNNDMNTNNPGDTINFSTDSTFKKYINDVKNMGDFDIQVSYLKNKDWYNTFEKNGGNSEANREKWKKYLMDYDMLIIGYKDSASFTNDELFIYGFEQFRQAGKSIILSHDLVSDPTVNGIMSKNLPDNTQNVLQPDVKYYLRDISGQIRKYYNTDSDNINDYSFMAYKSSGRSLTFEPDGLFKIYTSIYEDSSWSRKPEYLWVEDVKKTPVYDKYVYTYGVFDEDNNYTEHPVYKYKIQKPIRAIRDAYSLKNKEHKPANMIMDNSTRAMLYYNYINYNKNNNPKFQDKIDRHIDGINLDNNRNDLVWGGAQMITNKVSMVNEGQITKYPFKIDDTIEVAGTHAQNYQLDLEYDSDGDVLVWYDLAGDKTSGGLDLYKGRNLDSRNDYYIYTKDNITYTGLGHQSGMTDDEIKLFVNTMVAAYRSSASDPYITVTNPDAVNNGNNATLYVEDRDDRGSDFDITYRIDDDTTNSEVKSKREYQVIIYKGDTVPQNIIFNEIVPRVERREDGTEVPIIHKIPVSYSDVKANNEVKYTILLNSSYRNDQGEEVLSKTIKYITVALMPMFDLR